MMAGKVCRAVLWQAQTLAAPVHSCKRLTLVTFEHVKYLVEVFFSPGNGVVIHLPGLFEEAAKNESKGNGELTVVLLAQSANEGCGGKRACARSCL